LLRRGRALEAVGAGAHGSMVVAAAQRVRTADAFLFARVLAFAVDARLVRSAVLVGTTTEDAKSADARLLRSALRVAGTRQDAQLLHALLSG